MLGGDFVDSVLKQKVVGNSKKVTLSDPKDIPSRRSARAVNTRSSKDLNK